MLSLHPPLVCLLCASSSACSFAYAPLLSALLPQQVEEARLKVEEHESERLKVEEGYALTLNQDREWKRSRSITHV